MRHSYRRRRWLVLIALLGVVGLGVASRTVLRDIPIIGKELGDVLWAVMFYLIALLLVPTARPTSAAGFALVFSMGTEALQAYQAPWIDTLRANRVGGLLLGRYFSWHDMACYPVGTAIAWSVDRLLAPTGRKRHSLGA